jgi:hypothetical protein
LDPGEATDPAASDRGLIIYQTTGSRPSKSRNCQTILSKKKENQSKQAGEYVFIKAQSRGKHTYAPV